MTFAHIHFNQYYLTKTMKRLFSISIPKTRRSSTTTTSQNPNFHSQTFKNPNFSHPIQSKTVEDLIHGRPDSSIPNRESWKKSCLSFGREFTSAAQETKATSTERVSLIVDEISGLTLLEVFDLTEVLRQKMGVEEMPAMTVMMPGMGFSVKGTGKGDGGKVEEKAAEKTAFDLKLEGFDAAAKIKIIKEVRTFTDLGLKEAKDLVEKTPILLKKGVPKEEAEKIIEKMKEIGAKVVME